MVPRPTRREWWLVVVGDVSTCGCMLRWEPSMFSTKEMTDTSWV
jgi:hypothetical protein